MGNGSSHLDQRNNQIEEGGDDDGSENDYENDQNNNDGNNQGNDLNDNEENDRTEDFGDNSHHDNTTTITLEPSIELVKQNRPLLDRLGKFGKLLENLLQIGTAVSEVNYPSLLLAILVSDRSVG